jgi:hypothetical protein
MDQLSNLNDISVSLLGIAPVVLAAVIVALVLRYKDKASLGLFHVSTPLYLAAMLLTVVVMSVFCSLLRFSVFPPGGSDFYFARALNIVRLGVVGVGKTPNALFPPGYSFLMVPAALALGDSQWVFFLTNIAILVGTSVAVRFLLQKTDMPKGQANFVSLLLFLYPNRLLSTLLPFSDIPFSLVYLSAFLFMVLSTFHPERKTFPLFAGLLAGVAGLIRATGVPLILPLVLGIWVDRLPLHSPAPRESSLFLRSRNTALLLAGALALLMPWSIRNLVVFGKFIPVSSNLGYNLAIGNNPNAYIAHNGYIDSLARDPGEWKRFGGESAWNDAQVDSFLFRKGIEYIQQHPGSFLVRGCGKVLHTLASDASTFGMHETYGNLRTLVYGITRDLHLGPSATAVSYAMYATGYRVLFVLNNTIYYLSLALMLLMMIRHWRRWSGPELAYIAVFVITCALPFVLFGNSRFKEPIPSLTLVLVALSIWKGTPLSGTNAVISASEVGSER